MADPAIQSVIEAVISAVEGISPTIDPGTRFRRKGETAPASTRAPKRLINVEFQGHPEDSSNEGRGTQAPGLADRIVRLDLRVEYPVARSERALELAMAVDSELVLRALARSSAWVGTPVRRVVATTTVEREIELVQGQGTSVLTLVVAATVQYRDTE